MIRKQIVQAISALLVLLSLSACQPDASDRLTRAQEHMQSGDYAAAILEARGALQDEPANVEARIIFAKASSQVGDYRTAAAEYNRALQLGVDDPQVALDFADVLLVVGQAQVVIDQLAPNLLAEPKQALALTRLGHAYAATGQPDRATSLYEEAAALDTGLAEPIVGLATLAGGRGDQAQAKALLSRAETVEPGQPIIPLYRARIESDPEARMTYIVEAYDAIGEDTKPALKSQILVVKAEAHLRRGELNEAGAVVAEYEALNPGSAQSLFYRSLVQFERGDLEAAKEGFTRLSSAAENGSPADLYLGSINLQQSNLNQAEAFLNNAVRFNATSLQARKLLAETLLQLGRSKEALELLATLGSVSEDDPAVLSMLGRAAVASGDAAQGVEYFERSVAAAPGNQALVLATAYSYLASGDSASALEMLESVPAGKEDNYRASILRMLAHLSGNDRSSAIEEARQLVADNSDDATAYALAGQLMNSLGERPVARDFYMDALRLDPKNIDARYGIAQLKAAEQDLEGAFDELSTLLDQQPSYFPAISALGGIAVALDREPQAVARIRAAIEAAPENALPRALLAQYYLRKGELEQALSAADNGLEVAPDDAKLLQQRGRARLRLGQTEAARVDLFRAAELSPTDRDMQFDKARMELGSGDPVDARRTMELYLVQRPNDVGAQLFAADIDLRNDALERAEQVIDAVLANDPNNRTAMIMKGDVAARRDATDEALTLYRQAAAINRDRFITLRIYAARVRLGDEAAVDELNQWLEDNPDDTAVETIIAQSLDNSGDRAAAIRRYEEIVAGDVANDMQRGIVLNNLAWLYYTQGDDRALNLADQARRLLPKSGAALDTYAWIRFESGDVEAALPLLRRATELEPDNADIRYHLAAALAAGGEVEQAIRLLEQTLSQFEDFPEREKAAELLQEIR